VEITRGLEAFEALRPRLHGIAYRMTASVADAEDLCQDTWLRWQSVDLSSVDNPEAYLVSVITRLSIDRLRSAAHRRENYVGPYLPEPMVERTGDGRAASPTDPGDAAVLADSLTYAFLVLMDELTAPERAVLLLHDVFSYQFDEVAAAVDSTPAAVRQLASRARKKLDGRASAAPPTSADAHREALINLAMAVASGDIESVMAVLAPDVVQLDDGGPARRAARRPIVGPDRVARMWVNLAKRVEPTRTMEVVQVNGTLGLYFTEHGEPYMVVSVRLNADGLVDRIHAQLNPEKLRHLA